ncbi:phosphopantetheine-binding protein [Anaerosacchariphilus polymeriproducens]|uniref:Acyl carrier protein n=1 Tax=Anaerosacchariphilus polymeriproducens TaxID=1812858 RepID=A0A371AT08_9FIRM|nr:phosphopantetheine-binding protein [Anaerosacchariphilus polymeriproducens]RDU22701.1 acyl carrier protein [Anaerosacchariphilus polymeriproducens]
MKELMVILNELRPEVDFSTETNLLDGGILDSFDMVSLIGDINDTFEVELTFDDIDADNFNSAEAMWSMIERLKSEG